MKIASWNCNGVRRRKDELRIFMEEEDLAVVMLQETHLKPGDQIAFPGYQMFRKDREGAPGGGVAILVHNKICAQIRRMETEVEAIGAEIQNKNGKITLVSVYKPPRQNWEEEDLNSIFEDQRCLVGVTSILRVPPELQGAMQVREEATEMERRRGQHQNLWTRRRHIMSQW